VNNLDLRDRDLVSIQQARDLAAGAAAAQKKFGVFSQKQVDVVVEACAKAAAEMAEPLARRAVEETGFGNVADKTTKNRLASVEVAHAIRGLRTVGVLREDPERRLVEVASPIGVVAAVIPSTNPTSTAIYKTLISLKARNAIVLSPHPAAIRAICETAAILARAALSAGAPEGLISCMQHSTLAGTRELMGHRDVGVILATGGTGLVRAAYSSGKPAYGVGPGNVPAFIERTADVRKAIGDIFAGKTFDYGTLCSSEQSIVVEESLREAALEECRRQGGYFLSAEEAKKIGALVFQEGTHTPNTQVVGRPATQVAHLAGLSVPPATRVLIARLESQQVGRAFPLSAEKLSPILAFYTVPDLAAGIELCKRLLEFGGLGHTCAIHSQNDEAIRQFGQAVPAFRVCVNTSAVHGSIGYSTNLFPAMTLGCGAPGGNITSDNIGPLHLLNVKRIAWESRPVEHRTVPAEQRLAGSVATAGVPQAASAAGTGPSLLPPAPVSPSAASAAEVAGPAELDRARIAKVVEHALGERGIARGQGIVPAAPNTDPPSLASRPPISTPAEIASEIAGRIFRSDLGAKPAAPPQTSLPVKPAAEPVAPKPSQPPAIQVSPFVSENDVRRAITRGEKIFIGPKTILTPSARDLGFEHDVFVETKGTQA